MSNDKMMQRVIDVTRAFEKKHFGKKVEAPSSKLTTRQQAVVDVMKKENFGCNQQKVINLMSAVMGLDKKVFQSSKTTKRFPLERWLAMVDEDEVTQVTIYPKDGDGEFEFGGWCRDYLELEADWRLATNEEIGQFFEELYR